MEKEEKLMFHGKTKEEIEKTISSYVNLGWELLSISVDGIPGYTTATIKWNHPENPVRP